MRRSEVHIPRDYEKLAITASLKIESPSAGLNQYYKDGAYSPDHGITPLALTPLVNAKASDITPEQVWTVGNSSKDSGNGGTAWKVNGAAINSVWTAGTDYTLSDDGKTLAILRNIPQATSVNISCAILVHDSRTGLNIPSETDVVTLSTVAVSGATPRMAVDMDNVIWCPEADDLWEYEYRAARGLAQKMTEAEATNGGCYKKTVRFCVTDGGKQLSSGYGIWIKDSSDNDAAYITADGAVTNNLPVKILELTTESVTFDCRTIADEWFKVYAMDEESAILYTTLCQVHVKTTHRDYDQPEIVNHSDYTVRQSSYRNSLRVRCNGEEWDYPECYLDIKWLTRAKTTNAAEVERGAGNTCEFDPNEAGSGVTADDNGFDMIVDTDYHEQPGVATDESGNALTDENGNVLLI